MREAEFQMRVIKDIRAMMPTSVILKNDSGYMQGIPDLTILFGRRWGVLEVKIDALSPYQPNQEYYLELMGRMSFAATIHPSNKDKVLDELFKALTKSGGCSCSSESE